MSRTGKRLYPLAGLTWKWIVGAGAAKLGTAAPMERERKKGGLVRLVGNEHGP